MLTKRKTYFINYCEADMAKLADALDLGSSAARHGGSSPSIRTIKFIISQELGLHTFHKKALKLEAFRARKN